MRVLLAAAGTLLLLACAGAAATTAPAAKEADADVFGGLGTWVDIYDGAVYAAPERTAAAIAARGVKTAWVETSNYRVPEDVVQPSKLARLVDALHARGISVVGWYLPGHVSQALDLRRARALLAFRTPQGGDFDGIGLDVEATAVKNAALRTRRALAFVRQIRSEAGDRPLAIIPFNPRGLERHPKTWPNFPYAELAEQSDAFAPMVYTGGAMKGFDATYGYVTRSLRLLRDAVGDDDVPIHVAGGVANRLTADELAGFAAAVADDGRTIGVSLYDWPTTGATAWRVLVSLTETQLSG
jgi:hypothetical protein